MTTTRREFLQEAAASLVAAGLGHALHPARGFAQTPVKLGSAVLGDFALAGPIFVGLEKGYFKENGLAAEFVPFRGGPDLVKAVVAGDILLGVTGSTDILVFREAGAPIKMVASITDGNHFTLNVSPGIARVEQLKGKTIGVTRVGAATWVFARMMAQKMGWDPEKDVKIVGLGGMDAQLAAMARDEIQAFVWGDGGAVVEVQGKGKVLFRFDEVTPRWISQIAYTTELQIQKHPDAITKAVRGMIQTLRFMRDNIAEAAPIGAKVMGWPVEAVKLAHKIASPLYSLDGKINVDALKAMQDTLLEQKVIQKRLPLEDHYTAQFTPVKV